MRATRTETDLEYWSKAIDYWTRLEEEYFLLDDRAGEARCAEKKYQAILKHQEAQGLIVVYTGRANAQWKGVWAL